MIPTQNDDLLNGITFTSQPSNTFKLDMENEFLAGKTDGLFAVQQAVYLALNVERYDYLIYSWNYGVELADLFGQPTNYVCAVLPGRIREALLQDDRITDVDSFSFLRKRGVITTSFTVHTKYGDFSYSHELKI